MNILSLLRLSVEGEKWASDVMFYLSKLMINKCGCKEYSASTYLKCDSSCGSFLCDVRKKNDLIRGLCYFENKNASEPLTNLIYTRDEDPSFGMKEEGGIMQKNMSEWKGSWK